MYTRRPCSAGWAVLAVAALAVPGGCTFFSGAGRDTSPPAGSITINGDDDYAALPSVALGLACSADGGEAGITMMLSNAPDFAGASWETYSAARVWTLSAGDGVKTVYAKFRDAAGNESVVTADSIVLDSTLPGVPSVPDLAEADDTGSSGTDNITRRTSALTFSGAGGEPGCAVRLYDVRAGLLGSATADALGSWIVELDLAEGVYVLYSRAVDEALNESPSSPPLALMVDTTPPGGVPGILTPRQGENTGANRRPRFSWTAEDGEAFEIQADDSPTFENVDYDWTNVAGTSYAPGSDMHASGAVPVGTTYYLRIRALDAAGNAGPWSSSEPRRYVNVGRFDGDFNGDGFSDAIVGASGYDNDRGRVYLYLGGASMDTVADLTLSGEATSNNFGCCVAFAGDVNGDGYADAVVGAYACGGFQGRAYVYLGGPTLDPVADLILTGETAGSYFGYSVASAGDLDADGNADFIVGALGYEVSKGRAYIYLGGASLGGKADLILGGEVESEYFGQSVASAGDLNGDGYADAAVGAGSPGAEYRGQVYVYLGGPSVDAKPDLVLVGDARFAGLGASVASAGDVDGDGYGDLIVGAHLYDTMRGRAYLYLGGPAPDGTADLTFRDDGDSSEFGFSVASAGDVDGDGFGDLIVGACSYYMAQGRAYLYLGGPRPDHTADAIMDGEAVSNYFGTSVAPAGDLNGDGYADAIVGAAGYDSYRGRACIYLGGTSPAGVADRTMSGEGIANRFGTSVASVR